MGCRGYAGLRHWDWLCRLPTLFAAYGVRREP